MVAEPVEEAVAVEDGVPGCVEDAVVGCGGGVEGDVEVLLARGIGISTRRSVSASCQARSQCLFVNGSEGECGAIKRTACEAACSGGISAKAEVCGLLRVASVE